MESVSNCLRIGIERQYQALMENQPLLGLSGEQEALHDLRVALRALRSLTRPWRKADWCQGLLHSAGAFGLRSGPWRDLEVLCVELAEQGQVLALNARKAALETGYRLLRDDPALPLLEQQLEQVLTHLNQPQTGWPSSLTTGQLMAELERLQRRLGKELRRMEPDLHRVRIQVKRLRYLLQAFASSLAIAPELLAALQQCQSALGSWHDRWQWLQRSRVERDLRALTKVWRRQLADHEKQARQELQRLSRYTGALF